MSQRLRQHYTNAQLTISQEGILSATLAKVRSVFSRRPSRVDWEKNKGKLLNQYGDFNPKELSALLERVFPQGKVLPSTRFTTTVAGSGVADQLNYKGSLDLKDPIGFLRKAVGEIQSNCAAYTRITKAESERVRQIDAKCAAKIATLEDEDEDAIDAVLKAAITELKKMYGSPRQAVVDLVRLKMHWFGGVRTDAKKGTGNPRDYSDFLDRYRLTDVPVEYRNAPTELPALTGEQIEQALVLLQEVFVESGMAIDIWYVGYLDFEDGSPLSERMNDLDPSNWDEYVELTYFQGACRAFNQDFAAADNSLKALVTGLISWIDRSIQP